MKKGGSIIYFVILLIVIAVVILIYNSFGVYNAVDESMPEEEKVDMAELENDYKQAIKAILAEYQSMLEAETLHNLEKIKADLLSLKMPKAYREAHAKLVLLLDSLQENENFIKAREEFFEIIYSYDWLEL